MAMATLLVVDDDPNQRELYARRLARMGYAVLSASGGEEALEILAGNAIEVLITDYQMPGMDGCEIISRVRHTQPLLQSIVVTGYSDIRSAITAMGVGAFNYLQKPIDFAELGIIIEKGLEKRRLLLEVETKQRQLEEYRDQLEELVEKRTAALSDANRRLQEEIDERRALEQSLREAKVQAENANTAKSEFLANMSHEIRTPMTSAIGLLNLVLDTELTPKQKAYLEMARVSTVVMHNLLSDILDLSKIEAGKLHLERVVFQPAKVIESVVDLQHFQAAEKGIKLSTVLADDVPEAVVGDPNRLRQILLNLVSNAIKFTHFGEVVLTCERREAVEDANQGPLQLSFSVRDSGIGIPEDKIGIIFQAFTQADGSTTRRFGGVGLGLNICSKLVAMMGGRIWVDSRPGQGSVFYFTCRLDAAPHEEKNEEAPTASTEGAGLAPGCTGTVLVVEDDRTNQWVIREILEHQGYVVVNVADGESALEECRHRSFDLMLLDLKLPGMDGYEVVRRLRQREQEAAVDKEQRLPVIALTGMATEGERQRCLQAGMDDFLAKPFGLKQFIDKARQFVGAGRNRRNQIAKSKVRLQTKATLLIEERFDQAEALRRNSGDCALVGERLRRFFQEAPGGLSRLRHHLVGGNDPQAAEQEVHVLKEGALEIGATLLADELFSLLTMVRKQRLGAELAEKMTTIDREFRLLGEEQAVRALVREGVAVAGTDKD
jgi:signal transduction histidine kinase/HPt (histidine-containing phosphotransfer) domain-containing protein